MTADVGERLVTAGGTVRGRLLVPPSKSFTHRYFNLALLSGCEVVIERPLLAEDTQLFLEALRRCGVQVDLAGEEVRLRSGPRPQSAEIFCGNAGTLYRFLVATFSVLPGRWLLDGAPRLRERPISALVGALRSLGARIEYRGRDGYAPLSIEGGGLHGGSLRLDAGESSQYLSALLMAGQRLAGELTLEVEKLVSSPYVAITEQVIGEFGGNVERLERGRWRVGPRPLRGGRHRVEGDYSAACYPAAAALLTRGQVRLAGLRRESSQGDRLFFDLLAEIGARIVWQGDEVEVSAGGPLRAIEADLSGVPDQVPTLAALAPYCHGTTRIHGVPHLRLKESDRLAAMAGELARLGASVVETPDGLVIEGSWSEAPPPSEAVSVDSHADHRIAMSLALVGLRRPGVSIREPQTVGKSYPGFWADLDGLLR